MRIFRFLAVLLAGAVPAIGAAQQGVVQWEDEIAAFEQEDTQMGRAPGGVVFVGSSSIRFWDNMEEDFPTLDPINRGFGGSQLSDVRHYLDELVMKHDPRLIVLYAGENDVSFGRSPRDIFEDYKAIASRVRNELPETRLVWISIKPSPLRWEVADKMRGTNAMVMEYTSHDPMLDYVDVFMPMLNAQGEPRGELFVQDRLHLNAEGYRVWREELDPYVRAHGW